MGAYISSGLQLLPSLLPLLLNLLCKSLVLSQLLRKGPPGDMASLGCGQDALWILSRCTLESNVFRTP